MTFEILVDSTHALERIYQTTGYPETFVIGPEGVIRKKRIGADDWDSQGNRALVAQLLHLESEDPDKDISVYINSPGGSVYAGLAVYDTMQFIKPDVQTICVGIAMSMGALLLAGGAHSKRMALPNAKILIHQVSSSFQGQATDIEIHAKEIIDVRRRLDEIIAHHTGKELDQVRSDTERDYFMSSEEARDYGIIDRVISQH